MEICYSSSSSATLTGASIPIRPSPPRILQQSFSSASFLFFNNGLRTHDSIISNSKRSNTLILSRNRRGTCRSMFGLGMPEIAVIAGVATLVFGPKKLPEIGRTLGQTLKSFQKAAKEFESELKKESELAVEPALSEESIDLSGKDNKEDVKVPTTVESL
ncbi:hypothetical protein Sjap_008216 [Stephania japonica]|uniref:Sec-independent protein translocase protein TATA, chloroplastic n=1 Tax=Stephania japonica TaxID=461633 RepID=A0AAP0JP71_9MAGN